MNAIFTAPWGDASQVLFYTLAAVGLATHAVVGIVFGGRKTPGPDVRRGAPGPG